MSPDSNSLLFFHLWLPLSPSCSSYSVSSFSLSLPDSSAVPPLKSPLLRTHPPSPNTDLRLTWTLSQVKFAPASLGKAPSTDSQFRWEQKNSSLLLVLPVIPAELDADKKRSSIRTSSCSSSLRLPLFTPSITPWMGYCSVEIATRLVRC